MKDEEIYSVETPKTPAGVYILNLFLSRAFILLTLPSSTTGQLRAEDFFPFSNYYPHNTTDEIMYHLCNTSPHIGTFHSAYIIKTH